MFSYTKKMKENEQDRLLSEEELDQYVQTLVTLARFGDQESLNTLVMMGATEDSLMDLVAIDTDLLEYN